MCIISAEEKRGWLSRTHGAIAADLPVYRLRLHGKRPNADTRVAL